ncbi:MAG: hypothetical protein NT050_11790 [Verrucomicrobia bacterium]|nr:hypothetical protein [Verrucomicrobiota bacterium]
MAADAVFSLVGPAIEEYGDFRQSSNAAKTTGKANGTAKQIDDFVKSGIQVNINNAGVKISLMGIK